MYYITCNSITSDSHIKRLTVNTITTEPYEDKICFLENLINVFLSHSFLNFWSNFFVHAGYMGRQIDEQFGVNNTISAYDRSKENPLLLTEKKIYKHQNTKEIDKRILWTF